MCEIKFEIIDKGCLKGFSALIDKIVIRMLSLENLLR